MEKVWRNLLLNEKKILINIVLVAFDVAESTRYCSDYGVPPKTEKVFEKYLIPKIFEYMTGTESVDNIL